MYSETTSDEAQELHVGEAYIQRQINAKECSPSTVRQSLVTAADATFEQQTALLWNHLWNQSKCQSFSSWMTFEPKVSHL